MVDNNIGYIILEAPSTENIIRQPRILDISKDDVVIEAILQEAEVPNRNKRKYTKKAIESGINNPMFHEQLKNKKLFGEANHPLSDSIERQSVVDQTRLSHVIEKVWWEGNILKGEVAAANTAVGKDFASLVRQGCNMAFSMRGLGGVVKKEGDLTVVYDPLLIIAYDWILYPSHSNAYQTKILKENVQLVKENPILHEGILVPCDYQDSIKKYIMAESKNINGAINQLELDPKTARLTEDMSISLNCEEGKMVLFTEENIKKEINSFLKSLNL